VRISLNELPEEIRTFANHEGYFRVFLGFLLDKVERELIRRTITFVDGNMPEHRRSWESLVGLCTGNSSATMVDREIQRPI
jgi:hypothetical protein